MKKLIKMYNEKYGNTIGIIDDDFNNEQMYRIYYFIKNNCDDKDIQERLEKIKLDKPKTLEQQLTKLESEHNNGSSGDGSKMIPIPFTPGGSGYATISPQDINLKELLYMGGYIHVVVDVGISTLDIPLLFDKDNLLSYDSYMDMPVYNVEKTELICYSSGNGGDDISFKALRIQTNDVRLKEIDDKDRYLYITPHVYDLNETKGQNYDKNIRANITNIYFEPKNIPNSSKKEED